MCSKGTQQWQATLWRVMELLRASIGAAARLYRVARMLRAAGGPSSLCHDGDRPSWDRRKQRLKIGPILLLCSSSSASTIASVIRASGHPGMPGHHLRLRPTVIRQPSTRPGSRAE